MRKGDMSCTGDQDDMEQTFHSNQAEKRPGARRCGEHQVLSRAGAQHGASLFPFSEGSPLSSHPKGWTD